MANPSRLRDPSPGAAAPFNAESLRAPLLRYAARLLADVPQAQDVVQEVILRFAAQPVAELAGREAEWMFTVCRRRIIDLQRKSERITVTAPEELDQTAAPVPHPAIALESAEAQAALRESISALPANQQEVIRLKFQNGFSYKEIARITELSVGNVGFLIHTAVARLRRELSSKGLS